MRWRRIRREAYSLPVRRELDWGGSESDSYGGRICGAAAV